VNQRTANSNETKGDLSPSPLRPVSATKNDYAPLQGHGETRLPIDVPNQAQSTAANDMKLFTKSAGSTKSFEGKVDLADMEYIGDIFTAKIDGAIASMNTDNNEELHDKIDTIRESLVEYLEPKNLQKIYVSKRKASKTTVRDSRPVGITKPYRSLKSKRAVLKALTKIPAFDAVGMYYCTLCGEKYDERAKVENVCPNLCDAPSRREE
jgi:hypothetical protein